MNQPKYQLHAARISAEFQSRLEALGPGQRIQVVLLIRPSAAAAIQGKRGSRARRKAAIDAVRLSAADAIRPIDAALAHHGGRRLADGANALGAIPVETTVAGVRALAGLPGVQAIIEDQAILPLE